MFIFMGRIIILLSYIIAYLALPNKGDVPAMLKQVCSLFKEKQLFVEIAGENYIRSPKLTSGTSLSLLATIMAFSFLSFSTNATNFFLAYLCM